MSTLEQRCMNCMEPLFDDHVCLKCKHPVDTAQLPYALPYRAILQNRYIVGIAKKHGSQGFTYIGYDIILKNKIAIREYFPKSLCQRAGNELNILTNNSCADAYNHYKKQFLSLSRTIAHMRDLSAVDHIYDIFELNGTAYTISDWDEQVSLRYFVERSGGFLDWNLARKLFMPVLSALSTLHEKGIGHYGISLDSLSIMEDGKMKLGDFCIEDVRREGSRLPSDLVKGCAALEQYNSIEAFSESTDVYGFTASLFFALTGSLPEQATKRKSDARLLIPTTILKELPPHVVTSLANGLQVYRKKRTSNFERLRAELSASPIITAVIEETQNIPKITEDKLKCKKKSNNMNKSVVNRRNLPIWAWILISVVTMIIAVVAAMVMFNANDILISPETVDSSFVVDMQSEETNQDNVISADTASDDTVFSLSSSALTEVQIVTPNLVGKSYTVIKASEVQQVLDYEVLSSRYVFSDQVPEGYVVTQIPKAGDLMIKGGSIVVEVSQGSYKSVLPDVRGMSFEQASQRLKVQGFSVSGVFQSGATETSGSVSGYENYQVGDILSYGTHVVLIISSES